MRRIDSVRERTGSPLRIVSSVCWLNPVLRISSRIEYFGISFKSSESATTIFPSAEYSTGENVDKLKSLPCSHRLSVSYLDLFGKRGGGHFGHCPLNDFDEIAASLPMFGFCNTGICSPVVFGHFPHGGVIRITALAPDFDVTIGELLVRFYRLFIS